MTVDTAQPSIDRPRFRNDLVAQPIEEEGVRYVDVTDPSSGATFRFYDVEYSIACAMDGARDLGNLAEWTRAELGIEASDDELLSVINTLADLGYLEGAAPQAANEGEAVPQAVDNVPTEIVDEAPTTADQAPSSSSFTDEGIELGPPGKAPSPPAEEPAPKAEDAPIEEIELGPSGIVQDEELHRAEETIPAPPPGMEGPKSEAEISFAGLLDEEEQARQADAEVEPEVEPVRQIPSRPPAPPRQSLDDDDPTQVPAAHVEDDDDDVSVDLSAHLALDKHEVDEAVRSSRVHMVPEISEADIDLGGESESARAIREAAEAAATAPMETVRPPAPAAGPPPLPPPSPSIDDAGRTSDRSQTQPIEPARVTPAVPLPARPTPVIPATAKPRPSRPIEPQRMPPPAKAPPKSSSYMGVILVLLLAAAAFAAAVIFKDRIFGADDYAGRPRPPVATPSPSPTPPPAAPSPSPAPAAPGLPVAVMRAEEGGTAEKLQAKAASDGSIGWTLDDGTAVEADAVIVKLAGFARVEAKLAEGLDRGKFYQERLDAATLKNDPAAMEAAKRKVDEKKAIADEAAKELEALLVKAPGPGKVKLLAAKGAAVKAGDVVADIEADAAPVAALKATFDAGGAASSYAAGAACVVAARNANDRRFACVVEKVDDGKVHVRLVTAGGAASAVAGDDVVLLPADTK